MRTNIEIDDELMKEAMAASGAKTKREAVEAGLKMILRTHAQTGIRRLRGKVEGDWNLEESRLSRFPDWG